MFNTSQWILLYQTVLQTELQTMVLIEMFMVVVMMIKMNIVMVKYSVQEDEENGIEDDCGLGNTPLLILQQEVNGVVR